MNTMMMHTRMSAIRKAPMATTTFRLPGNNGNNRNLEKISTHGSLTDDSEQESLQSPFQNV